MFGLSRSFGSSQNPFCELVLQLKLEATKKTYMTQHYGSFSSRFTLHEPLGPCQFLLGVEHQEDAGAKRVRVDFLITPVEHRIKLGHLLYRAQDERVFRRRHVPVKSRMLVISQVPG